MSTEEYIRHRLEVISSELDKLEVLAYRISNEELAQDINKASAAVWKAV